MQDYMIQTKDRLANVCEHKGFWLVGVTSLKSGRHLATYRLKDYPKFNSYSALVKYAKANHLDTTSQQVNDLPSDDLACVVSPSSSVELHPSNDALTDDSHSPVQSPIINSDVAFENGSLAGESSPVAASSYPATSDTLFIFKHYPQTCSQCKTSLSDFNTNDLNPICNACLWFSEEVDETDLYEDD